MGEIRAGTSGGDMGASGVQRRLALAMTGGFALILTFVTIANAESLISDFRAAGIRETEAHVWMWELTSIAAWLSLTPAIWWAVRHIRPPGWSWPTIAALFVAGLFVASAWHIGVMIALRTLFYALEGIRYRFEGGIANPYVYEFRKDVGTYLQFTTLAILCQWLLARVGTAPIIVASSEDRYLAVSDGAVTHQVPIDDVIQLTAAGNYVEIEIAGRTLLNRATLATMENELGSRFVRIHRSRLVNRDVIRRVETNQSGDFTLVLADGRSVKGSRRYRAGLEQRL